MTKQTIVTALVHGLCEYFKKMAGLSSKYILTRLIKSGGGVNFMVDNR